MTTPPAEHRGYLASFANGVLLVLHGELTDDEFSSRSDVQNDATSAASWTMESDDKSSLMSSPCRLGKIPVAEALWLVTPTLTPESTAHPNVLPVPLNLDGNWAKSAVPKAHLMTMASLANNTSAISRPLATTIRLSVHANSGHAPFPKILKCK